VARFTTTVAATQSLAFADDTGTLQITNPSSFGATIFAFRVGNTIDLAGINATSASWAPGALSIFNGTTLLATLAIAGDYSAATFHVNSDGANGSAITVGAPAPCFAAGSRILTPRGNVAIERLREGDMVLTVSGKHERIQWIGYRHVDCRRHISPKRALPIRIAAHAFGQDRPKRPLLLSPDHSVYVEGVLIPIKFLVNDGTILQIDVDAVSYFHIELDRHEIVLAEGLPVETYLETGGRNAFANTGEVMQLHPDFAPDEARVAMIWQSFGYAPLIGSDGELERTMRMLEIQADLLCTPLRRRRRRG
jgi:Hint domain